VPSSWRWPRSGRRRSPPGRNALATTGMGPVRRARRSTTPICATTACQVYRGIPLTPSPDTARWYRRCEHRRRGAPLPGPARGEPSTSRPRTGRPHERGRLRQLTAAVPAPLVWNATNGASRCRAGGSGCGSKTLARFLAEAGEWPNGASISDVRLEADRARLGRRRCPLDDARDFRDAVTRGALPRAAPVPPGGLPTTIPSGGSRSRAVRRP